LGKLEEDARLGQGVLASQHSLAQDSDLLGVEPVEGPNGSRFLVDVHTCTSHGLGQHRSGMVASVKKLVAYVK
jgi:hypothetical protein